MQNLKIPYSILCMKESLYYVEDGGTNIDGNAVKGSLQTFSSALVCYQIHNYFKRNYGGVPGGPDPCPFYKTSQSSRLFFIFR